MLSKTFFRKLIAVSVAVAVWSVYSKVTLANPGAQMGAISVIGETKVNGQNVISGGTIFPDSLIVTAARSQATVSLSKMAQIVLAPETSLKLAFKDSSITCSLDAGRVRVSTLSGVSVKVTTKEGSVLVDGTQETSFTVGGENGRTTVVTHSGLAELRSGTTTKLIAAGGDGTAGKPPSGPPSLLSSLPSWLKAIIITVVAVIWITISIIVVSNGKSCKFTFSTGIGDDIELLPGGIVISKSTFQDGSIHTTQLCP